MLFILFFLENSALHHANDVAYIHKPQCRACVLEEIKAKHRLQIGASEVYLKNTAYHDIEFLRCGERGTYNNMRCMRDL